MCAIVALRVLVVVLVLGFVFRYVVCLLFVMVHCAVHGCCVVRVSLVCMCALCCVVFVCVRSAVAVAVAYVCIGVVALCWRLFRRWSGLWLFSFLCCLSFFYCVWLCG